MEDGVYRVGKRVEAFFIGTHYFRWGHVRYTDTMDIGYMHEHFKAITGVFKTYRLKHT